MKFASIQRGPKMKAYILGHKGMANIREMDPTAHLTPKEIKVKGIKDELSRLGRISLLQTPRGSLL